jgi:alkyl sulfatase BDS1-like metallo-beta-lactamase superfamily hydrolase
VQDYLEKQRDIYKFTHDQTLRLASRGLTPNEIAAALELPPSLRDNFATRGYYGTLRHNAKAVYQYYFGWYDGNPVNLDPLPPEEQAQRYVAAMGGAAATLERAREAYGAGDFQWAARLAHHVVFADPGDEAGRVLLARAFEQLGYRAESGPWRDIYLSGALELRHGIAERSALDSAGNILGAIPIELFLVALATNVDPAKAEGRVLTVNLEVPEREARFTLLLDNSVLNHRPGLAPDADATLRISHPLLLKVLTGSARIADLVAEDAVAVDGSILALGRFFASFSRPYVDAFPVSTP